MEFSDRRSLYTGPDQSQLDSFEIDLEGSVVVVPAGALEVLRSDSLHPSLVLKLLAGGCARPNAYQSYDSVDGLLLHSTVVDGQTIVVSRGERQPGLYDLVFETSFVPGDVKPTVVCHNFYTLSYEQGPQIRKLHGADATGISEAQRMRAVPDGFLTDRVFAAALAAERTDFMSSAFLAYAGFFVSDAVMSLLSGRGLMFTSTQVQFTNEVVASWFWEFPAAPIDFEQSSFVQLAVDRGATIRPDIVDGSTHQAAMADAVLGTPRSRIKPRFLMLERPITAASIPGELAMIVSEEVVDAMRSAAITGCLFEPYEVPVFSRS